MIRNDTYDDDILLKKSISMYAGVLIVGSYHNYHLVEITMPSQLRIQNKKSINASIGSKETKG